MAAPTTRTSYRDIFLLACCQALLLVNNAGLIASFALFCLGTAIIGVYTAFGLQYRFAAAEVAAPEFRAKAISLVLAGGIVGGFLGPEASRWAKDLLPVSFLGSFVVLAVIALVALSVQSRIRVPPPTLATGRGGRPLAEIARAPVFMVAVLSAALGYGVMNLLMTATPLAMSFCGYPFAAAAFVIEWHVVGMYAPGFVTGNLIQRFGALRVIIAGTLLMAACAGVALADNRIAHFWAALFLLGVGWNLMYTGDTALLTEAYTPAEKAKTQGLNDLVVFAVMGISSFSSGALINAAGWERMNTLALPFVAAVMLVALWLLVLRRRGASSVRVRPKAM